jgi:two-component system chemotaxis response regulator CheB
MRPVRVLIVDDQASMRGLIRANLSRDPEIEVVGEAADAGDARAAIKALNPDVITLDVEMPRMNGIDFLDKIMRLRPTPVIMVSSLTGRGAAATLEALEIGAFDCVAKPSPGDTEHFAGLTTKVKAAAGARPRPRGEHAHRAAPSLSQNGAYRSDGSIVAIGASTGGVEALIEVLSGFPADCSPTVITQHMPATFTASFAKRLDRLCKPVVREAEDGALLAPGRIYLAPGGAAHLLVSASMPLRCRLKASEPMNGHRPSVDVLFHSVAAAAGRHAVGVILTGMGRDGADGLLAMRRAGAATFGQDEASCVIYGMPKAAHEIGATGKQVPLSRIASEILKTTCVKGDDRCPSHQPSES